MDSPIEIHEQRLRNQPHMLGHCNICGTQAAFAAANMASWRESLNCSNCGAFSRYRSLARGLLAAIFSLRGIGADSLAALPKKAEVEQLAIYDTQLPFYYNEASYPLPDILDECEWITVFSSVFLPDQEWGKDVGVNRTNQNLEALTYDDNAFDIVLTSEVLEHVRLDERAHNEIRRVLRPGGYYLFTVPHDMGAEKNTIRVVIHDPDDPSKDEHVMEPEYHGTGTNGELPPLAYRSFGQELLSDLDKLGFDISYNNDDVPENAIMGTELFFARKR